MDESGIFDYTRWPDDDWSEETARVALIDFGGFAAMHAAGASFTLAADAATEAFKKIGATTDTAHAAYMKRMAEQIKTAFAVPIPVLKPLYECDRLDDLHQAMKDEPLKKVKTDRSYPVPKKKRFRLRRR